MNVSIQNLNPIPVLLVRHRGSYDGIAPVFDRLVEWADQMGVPRQRTIGIYYDNPDHVLKIFLRSAACLEVPMGYQPPAAPGLKIEVSQIAGGRYASMRYTGPYEEMSPVWSSFTSYVEVTLGHTIGQNPAFEVYVNDPADTPARELITDMYMPIL